MNTFDPKKIAADLQWLKDHPWFDEKPASIIEFLGEDYLNIEKGIRPGVKEELIALFGEEVNGQRIAMYRWGMFTGAIGIGKTTMASIVLPYMAHWVLCLKNPQDFYDLLPGSRIAFMQMSTSEDQAKETVFGDIKARIEYSPWFVNNYPFDPSFKNQIRFEKDIWMLPGSSLETAFEGYNILGGILDEADSHKQTQTKDYAEVGFDTINSRIDSRFQDRGFLLVVGQMKKANGFAAKKYRELNDDGENAHTVRMTIWESIGWEKLGAIDSDGKRVSFWYDTKRKTIVTEEAAQIIGYPEHILEIPKIYEKNFRNNPEKALRDLAGIPPLAGSAFISLSHKIEDAVARWIDLFGDESPISEDTAHPQIAEWFKCQTPLKRSLHLDIGITNDAAGIVMGHVSHLIKDDDGEEKPFIVIDAMLRVKAPKGGEVLLSDLRGYIYDFKERGFRIRNVTMDGFQSTDTRQQLRKRKFLTDYLSVDKSKLPYEDLRDALYEDRIAIPPYVTHINVGDSELVQVAVRELSELEDTGKKVDHPSGGSKDIADGLAGVTTTLMGDRVYRRNIHSPSQSDQTETLEGTGTDGQTYDPYGFGKRLSGYGGMGLKAPVPPNVINFPTPSSLRGDRR